MLRGRHGFAMTLTDQDGSAAPVAAMPLGGYPNR